MWPYLPDLLAVPVPRYTSYPTAAEFGPAEPQAFYNALEETQSDISLYVHIPYCHEICWYCGCNTGAANRQKRLAAYLEALMHEIAMVGAAVPQDCNVRYIAFGGGSPNAIAPTDFVRLIDALTLAFPLADPVISIELDPRSLTEPWREVISHVGVERASMGVQTFDPAIQQAIGRVQPVELIERATDMLRRAGVKSLNFDLMYGLPGQDHDRLLASVDKTAELGADRIALFGLAYLPEMFPRQKRIDGSNLPDARTRFDMMQAGYERLVDHGYDPVGFDHFALPGDPLSRATLSGRLHRNFQGFTDDAAPVTIGLGASAISCFPQGIYQNEKNAGRYRTAIAEGRHPTFMGVARSAEDRRRAKAITGVLCHGHTRIDEALLAGASPRLAQFIDAGLCTIEGGVLTLSANALPYARGIAACFDSYRIGSARKFSNAV
ncbi:oxygen-independent coproporphyrinogen III oxidase [Croceicoccus bisphenolivorans]|uniref:oxygen-independent coproporphyrinogen III oxidase n=1 Tax=Croceicoccus bisphenolivorans TaxID=1783232 RepID=UPI00082F2B91|nr:oxygen-independent coproporphyrinogen III oxidase [Croceicoccus bisphenolivorans]